MGLKQLLIDSGIDLVRDEVKIAPVPGAVGSTVNFGLTAAKALEEKKIDGFWANGMGTEVAVSSGAGKVVLDVRRGDGPRRAFHYTMASLAAREALISRDLDTAAAAVRAIVKTHAALKKDLSLAVKAGQSLFPEREAGLIAELVRRDLPFYDASIGEEFVSGMNGFARAQGILKGDAPYEKVVATEFEDLWRA
jgi:ABC-type nitrate/sulfonate/bicarbonate transport system substrate-binding protein